MVTRFIILAAAGLIACAAFLQKAVSRSTPFSDPRHVTTVQETIGNNEEHHPAGGEPGCQAGCSISSHPVEPLTRPEYLNLLQTFASGDAESRVAALETLLFYGRDVREWIEGPDGQILSEDQTVLLREELSKTHVRLWLRLVDDNGVVRGKIDGARMPISEKTHVHMTDTSDLPAPEVSGTVYRTGLHHLWTRI